MPTFEPPTHEEPIRTNVRPLNYYRLTYAHSVVRVNGILTTVAHPTDTQLREAGTEGTDYFMGGHIYTVTPAVATELTNAGYSVTP